jgi:hypothetical protein
MSSKKTAAKTTSHRGTHDKGRRVLSIFRTEISSLVEEERAKLVFKPDSIAETIIRALEKHGVEAGEARKKVVGEVRAKFAQAHDSTIRTQVYRGIAYLRAGPRP